MKNEDKVSNQMNYFSSLDPGLPPLFQSTTDAVRDIFTNIDDLHIHTIQISKCIVPRKVNLDACLSINLAPPTTTINVEHDLLTGEMLGFNEVMIDGDHNQTSKTSTSLLRKPGYISEGIRGNTENCPFWPGGFDKPDISELLKDGLADDDHDILQTDNLLTTPPGFSTGGNFERKNCDWLTTDQSAASLSLNSLKELFEDDDTGIFSLAKKTKVDGDGEVPKGTEADVSSEGLKRLTSEVIVLSHIHEATSSSHSSYNNQSSSRNNYDDDGEDVAGKFVNVVDVQKPVKNFRKLLPVMALNFEFELDSFQKQAILLMERKQNVFVAAHTSAGKTVVAEYAIALSLNHMTKVIYTSPIKALSNQKFRDFKNKFGDVGLVTGDVQIAPEANVLVMTTEILRSMLYNGSDVIRDLEWVIFDEVHYINDADRGVVWEEVLILLPEHVKIAMLSATVPNTKEFAEWVGRTKKKMVNVISTTKRPVPLEHFIYTGTNQKTSKEFFLILDADRNFVTDGYKKAVEAVRSRSSKKSDQQFGGKGVKYNVNPKQEQQIWLSLIHELERQSKLPAVSFVFSKRRINENADRLTSLDLLDSSERSKVVVFFNKSLQMLKPPDRELPQVRSLRDLLVRGIGVHHSGILPILKEIVEMLFQRGLVKILFATETFAMGVNMPAKTVIFDSIQKHDGERMRNLLPGEYIQMAGRAGRRGLDKTGTVIILCKNEMPEMSDLHKMMMGIPTTLSSQFRVTYSMVLNLLRVEQLRMEDMLRKSFSEFGSLKGSEKLKERLNELQQMKGSKQSADQFEGSGFSSTFTLLSDLAKFYDICDEYYKIKDKIMSKLTSSSFSSKTLVVGRLVAVSKIGDCDDVIGVLLSTASGIGSGKHYKVLVNCDRKLNNTLPADDSKDIKPRHYVGLRPYLPTGSISARIFELSANRFSAIFRNCLKVNADKIIEDVRKRDMPRFKDDLPSPSTQQASQELMKIAKDIYAGDNLKNPTPPALLDPVSDLHIHEVDVVELSQRYKFLESFGSGEEFKCQESDLFVEKFREYRAEAKIDEEMKEIRYKLSDESLLFLPEYQQRVEVLRSLKCVDPRSNTIRLKGKVACEISHQELILTEVIFQNILSDFPPEVIAALLSCLVFEQKRCSEPNLNKVLKEAKEKFVRLAANLTEVQRHHGLLGVDVLEECNFGLMEVVYEWAKGVPFAKLMELTDVEEGVIVRCIQRLSETFRDLTKVSNIIGDPVLSKKVEEGLRMIKRDIVFAASLYVQ